jgi:hypothetical protein
MRFVIKRCFGAVLMALLFCLSSVAAQAQAARQLPAFTLDKRVHDAVPFIPHSGAGAFDNYLTMNLPFAPVESLWKSLQHILQHILQQTLQKPLVNRGEAHITVITPVEFSTVLGNVMTMRNIDSIASAMNLQAARFTCACLGRAQITVNGAIEQTYYVVVQSDDIRAVRRAIFKHFVEQGGEPSLFDPERCYLHITVGFTKQDLHEETHGVRKGANSCVADIVER